jgi:mRNA-degrading endonuclease toxin of MazEF toxin-antitoxin module
MPENITTNAFQKDFDGWNELKTRIDAKNHKPPEVSVGQIWWSIFGENIGTEMCGKSAIFTRPVMILHKLSKYRFLVVPLSTKSKVGSWFAPFTFKDKELIADLSQIRVIDYRRLYDMMGTLPSQDIELIQKKFQELYNFEQKICPLR